MRTMSRTIPPNVKSVSSSSAARASFSGLADWPSPGERPHRPEPPWPHWPAAGSACPPAVPSRLVNSPPNAAPSTIPMPERGYSRLASRASKMIAGHQPSLGDQHDAEQADKNIQHIDHPRADESGPTWPPGRQPTEPSSRTPRSAAKSWLPACCRDMRKRRRTRQSGYKAMATYHIEFGQEHRPRYRLQDVVGEQNAEKVEKHGPGSQMLARSDIEHCCFSERSRFILSRTRSVQLARQSRNYGPSPDFGDHRFCRVRSGTRSSANTCGRLSYSGLQTVAAVE